MFAVARHWRLAGAALIALGLAACEAREAAGPHAAAEDRRAELRAAIEADPDNAQLQQDLGQVLIDLADGTGAEAAIRKAEQLGGDARMLRPQLARAVALQGEPKRALDVLGGGAIADKAIGDAAWVEGVIQLDQGDLIASRRAFDIAVRRMPRNAALWVDVARYREANADIMGARDAVDYAIELDAGESRALALKANLVRSMDGLTASLPWYDKALAANPDNVSALLDHAATLGDLGRYGEMLDAVRRAAKLAPKDVRPYYLQAVLAARAGNFLLARSLLQRTRGEMDEVPGFLLLSAIVELELGGEAVAADLAENLLTLQPNNLTARRLLAVANWTNGDSEGAADAIDAIVARDDADRWSLHLAALVAADRGKPGDAAMFLQRAARLSRGEAIPFAESGSVGVLASAANARPLDPSAVIPAARSEIRSGAAATALARTLRLRDANRGVADAHLLVGDAAMAAGQPGLASRAYREARRLDASERTTLRLANAQRRAGDIAGSAATIMELRDRQPSSVAADRLAGHLAMDLRQWDNAIRYFERVRRKLGNRDVVVLRELARAYQAAGRTETALAYARQAYRLEPLNPGLMLHYAELAAALRDPQTAADLRAKADAYDRTVGR